jgi:hypothetical protein
MKDPFSGLSMPLVPAHSAIRPIPNLANLRTAAQANYASEFHSQLSEFIQQFEATLDPSHAVGVRLVSFGQSFEFHLEDMGYHNPSLITFFGRGLTGQPVQLIQHVTQISILLMAIEVPVGTKKPIGFGDTHTPDDAADLETLTE